MDSQVPAEILGAAMSNNLPQSHIRRPSTFLSLAPTTSASYPQQRPFSPTSSATPKFAAAEAGESPSTTESAAAVTETVPVAATVAAPEELDASGNPKPKRRSSSLTSDESGSPKLRFLKLGPVHWGEGDGKGDWSEVGVAE